MIGTKVVYTMRSVSLRILNLISRLFEDGMIAPQIPLDLISEILIRLPAKSVLRFKCVCKEWYNLINSPRFGLLNSQHKCIVYWTTSTLCIVDDLYHPVKVTKLNWPIPTRDDNRIYHVGSCNGLICFNVTTVPYYRTWCFLICNPTTRTLKGIYPPSEIIRALYNFTCGFGYDSEHDDFKIVGTKPVWRDDDRDRHVVIYSLKTDLWSSPTPLPCDLTGRCLRIVGSVIFENNMLHYLVSPVSERLINDYKIARFDVASEKWIDDLSLPDQVKNNAGLGMLDGRLYVHGRNNVDLHSSDIWMMEDGSWKKMFYLPGDFDGHRLIARSKDGHNRLLLQDYYGERNVLKWYDERDKTTRPLKLEPLPKDGFEIIFTASLIRIPGRRSLMKFQEIKETKGMRRKE